MSPPLKWYYRPVWVLLLLFVVLGPFGLPYLWKSPSFSRGMKVVLTVLLVAYMGVFVGERSGSTGRLRPRWTRSESAISESSCWTTSYLENRRLLSDLHDAIFDPALEN